MNNTYLAHHGVKGMKWGVRRYQNYDGTYTQAGLKRFNKSLSDHESAILSYKNAKKSKANKVVKKAAKIEVKRTKNQLNKDYKHLKQDKLADQGKYLYTMGERVRDNNKREKILKTVGLYTFAGAAFIKESGLDKVLANRLYFSTKGKIGKKHIDIVLNTIGGVGAASIIYGNVDGAISNYKNKRLSAYYSHTSKY